MRDSPEQLNQVLARWWSKILVADCADVPEERAYYEHAEARSPEALQSQDGEDQKAVVQELA